MAGVFGIIAFILALVGTIVSFVLIVPDKKRRSLNSFGVFLHDLFNFKYLIIEKILQFCYILSTIFIICYGILMLFCFQETWGGYYGGTRLVWVGWSGFLILLIGPVVTRLVYEASMMLIIAIKNIIQINNKLKNQNEKAENNDVFSAAPSANSYFRNNNAAPAAPTAPVAPATPAAPTAAPTTAAPQFCTRCGAPINANGKCSNPNCIGSF